MICIIYHDSNYICIINGIINNLFCFQYFIAANCETKEILKNQKQSNKRIIRNSLNIFLIFTIPFPNKMYDFIQSKRCEICIMLNISMENHRCKRYNVKSNGRGNL